MEPFSKTTSPTDTPRGRGRRACARAAALAIGVLVFAVPWSRPVAAGDAPDEIALQATVPAKPTASGGAVDAAPVEGSGQSPITVEADSLEVEKEGGKVHAAGAVVVEWDTTKLRAADLRVDQSERRVEATGGVTYESDDMHATAASAHLDIDDETGVLDKVDMHIEGQSGRFGGDRVEKAEGRHLLLDEGYFTTCDTDKGHAPDWELRGQHLDLRLDDYARVKGARLELRGVPILYLPYLVFPTKQTRQSGLLPFFIGTSTNRGVIFSLPGYWAIDKHQDLTMTAVVETSARLGLDGVWRYAPSRKRWGELHAAFYNESLRGDPKPGTATVGIPDNRGSVDLTHREHGDGWTGYADVEWVGDERYLREITALDGDGPERELRRSRRYTSSRAGAMLQHGFTSAGVEAIAYQDLVGEVIDDGNSTTTDPVRRDTLHKPLNGWVQTDGGVGPIAYAVNSSLASFVRDQGADGERLDFASTMDLPLLTDGPVRSRAWAKGQGNLYAMNQRNELDQTGAFVQRLGALPSQGIFEAGVDTRTKIARQYAVKDSANWSAFYHSVEPFTALRYAQRSSWDVVPLFDRLDAVDGRDVATYGVDQAFLLKRRPGGPKAGGSPFELGRLSLSQSYNLTRDVLAGGGGHLSDIDLAAFVQPLEGFAVRTLASYNAGANQLRGANASISWQTGPFGPLLRGPGSQVAAAYRYVRSDTVDNVLQSTEMLARLAFTRNVSLGLRGLYDIVGKKFVEKGAGFTFTSSCDCWSVGLGVIDRVNPSAIYRVGTQGSPNEVQVRLSFELKGLGGFGSGVTQRTSPALGSVEYDDVGFWRAGW